MTNPTPAQHHRATEITNEIATLGFALPGSLALRYTTCGTPGCRCHADPPRPHGRRSRPPSSRTCFAGGVLLPMSYQTVY